jgi:hypothetical protein
MVDSILNENQIKLYFRGINYVKLAFEQALRYAFGSGILPPRFLYTTDPKTTKITIFRQMPNRPENFPCIVIRCKAAVNSIFYLGNEELHEIDDDNGNPLYYVTNGPGKIKVDLDVVAKNSESDRELVVDLVLMLMRHVFRNKFAELKLPYVMVRAGDETEEKIADGWLYQQTISTEIETQFEQNIPSSLFTLVDQFNVTLTPETTVTNPINT